MRWLSRRSIKNNQIMRLYYEVTFLCWLGLACCCFCWFVGFDLLVLVCRFLGVMDYRFIDLLVCLWTHIFICFGCVKIILKWWLVDLDFH